MSRKTTINKKVTLESAVKMNRLYPNTFPIPDHSTRANMNVGELVKLIFKENGTRNVERMWVIITEKKGNGKYVGRLDNDPFFIDASYSDLIEFTKDHIINFDVI